MPHPNESLLADRTALVAGGAGNVGQYLVRALLEHGATVIVPSRSADRLAALRSAVGERSVDRLIGIEGDIGDETKAAKLQEQLKASHGMLHAAVTTLGRFIAAPSVLAAPLADLRTTLNDYLIAHFLAARTLIPLMERGGSYTVINGPLAFDSLFEGTGLVSIATAGQAMLARVLMKELQPASVRLNQVVLYTPFGWGDKVPLGAAVSPEDVGRYIAYLASFKGDGLHGQTIHLKSHQPLEALEAPARVQDA